MGKIILKSKTRTIILIRIIIKKNFVNDFLENNKILKVTELVLVFVLV